MYFGTKKAWPWWGDVPSFNWKETGLVLQSPKVPSKSNSYLMRSCSEFFRYLALRCFQLSLNDYLKICFVVFGILNLSFMLGSKLLFSFSAQSILAPCRWLMFHTGKMILSMVIVFALKSSSISLFLYQESGHTVGYYPSCTQPQWLLNSTFCNQNIQRSSALP